MTIKPWVEVNTVILYHGLRDLDPYDIALETIYCIE